MHIWNNVNDFRPTATENMKLLCSLDTAEIGRGRACANSLWEYGRCCYFEKLVQLERTFTIFWRRIPYKPPWSLESNLGKKKHQLDGLVQKLHGLKKNIIISF